MQIAHRDAFTVVGIPVRASWQDLWTVMPATWEQFAARASEIAHRSNDLFLDVSLEQAQGQYLQLVCAEVSRVEQVPQGMIAVEIPSQSYLYHRHTGDLAGIAESFGAIYAWAEERGEAASSFKLDIGYGAVDQAHELYVGLLPAKAWRRVSGQDVVGPSGADSW
jgi:predicted transcriptional regulator YdeE